MSTENGADPKAALPAAQLIQVLAEKYPPTQSDTAQRVSDMLQRMESTTRMLIEAVDNTNDLRVPVAIAKNGAARFGGSVLQGEALTSTCAAAEVAYGVYIEQWPGLAFKSIADGNRVEFISLCMIEALDYAKTAGEEAGAVAAMTRNVIFSTWPAAHVVMCRVAGRNLTEFVVVSVADVPSDNKTLYEITCAYGMSKEGHLVDAPAGSANGDPFRHPDAEDWEEPPRTFIPKWT